MRKKHKMLVLIIFSVILIVTMICVIWANIKEYKTALSMQIEDKNGDEKTLCVITDKMIESVDYRHISIMHRVYREGPNSSNVQGELKKCDYSYLKIKSKMLSGVYLCNAYRGKGKTVTFTIKSLVKSGNCKIVITDSDHKIVKEIPIDQQAEVSFFAPQDSLFFVKCVGESANLELVIRRNDDSH